MRAMDKAFRVVRDVEALKPVITFEVYSEGVRVGVATRSMRQHSGWESVVFQGRRYQLFGGIRTAHRINLEHPLRKRVS